MKVPALPDNEQERLAALRRYAVLDTPAEPEFDALNALENVQAVKLDVTVQDEIDAAVETVRNGGRGLHGLFDSQPKARYMVVPNQEEARRTIGEAIRELVELNEDQPYSYSREQLVEMLDAAMAVSRSPASR